MQILANFSAKLELSALPNRIVEKAAACLLYGLAVGIASARAPQPRVASRLRMTGEGPPEATQLLDGARVSAEQACFANATLFHARCQEDAHPAGHLGTVVLPVSLAMAEATRASGADLIAAIIAGYEVALRIGRDHVVDLSARGFRSTSAYGSFGAAAAAARLRGLDPARTAHALALAANAAAGLRAFVAAGSEDFPYHAGFAAHGGVLAAALAANGGEGPPDALSGEGGFFAAFGTPERDYARRVADGLGEQFEMEDVTFKPYPTCQFHRAIVRDLIRLRAEAAGSPVVSIQIRMHPAEADFWGVRFGGPFRRFSQAFMSAPFCAAVAWAKGTVRFDDLHEFDRPDVLELAQRVTVVADAGRPRYRPSVAVTLEDGRRLVSDETGENYRLTWDSAVAMAHSLTAEVGVPTPIAERLERSAKGAAGLPNVDDLMMTACSAVRTVRSADTPELETSRH